MSTDAFGRLVEVLGEQHVARSREGAGVGLVARPGDIAQACRVVRLAHDRNWKLRVRGGGTSPASFPVPGPVDLTIDLRRLDRLIEHRPEELVAAIECGRSFRESQRRLADAGQRIPLDAPFPDGATVGGVLAQNRFGPRRLRYGTARDWVIGTGLIRFDGRLVESGGMVVKNVSGYDLTKLYLGSWGSLGILVRANFKLDPVPAAEELLAFDVPDGATAHRIVSAARGLSAALDSAVYLRGAGPLSGDGVLPGKRDANRLLLGLDGLPEVVRGHSDRLADLAAREGAGNCRRVVGPDCTPLRERLAEIQTAREADLLLRLTYPQSAYPAVMQALARLDPGGGFSEMSLLGSGVTWLAHRAADDPEALRARTAALGEQCATRGGWLMIERRPAAGFDLVPAWTIPAPELRWMQRLKSALDPPGRFVDGPFCGGDPDG